MLRREPSGALAGSVGPSTMDDNEDADDNSV
jgi:hypothetical protein